MEKPKLYTKEYYDYRECATYIEEKYGVKEDDFWKYESDFVNNGSFFSVDANDIEMIEDSDNSKGLDFARLLIDEFTEDALYYVWW